MEYIFTDWDCRNYPRKTDTEVTIKSEQMTAGNVKISFLTSGKFFFTLILNKRETAGIASALNAADGGCKTTISV